MLVWNVYSDSRRCFSCSFSYFFASSCGFWLAWISLSTADKWFLFTMVFAHAILAKFQLDPRLPLDLVLRPGCQKTQRSQLVSYVVNICNMALECQLYFLFRLLLPSLFLRVNSGDSDILTCIEPLLISSFWDESWQTILGMFFTIYAIFYSAVGGVVESFRNIFFSTLFLRAVEEFKAPFVPSASVPEEGE